MGHRGKLPLFPTVLDVRLLVMEVPMELTQCFRQAGGKHVFSLGLAMVSERVNDLVNVQLRCRYISCWWRRCTECEFSIFHLQNSCVCQIIVVVTLHFIQCALHQELVPNDTLFQ